MARAAQPGDRDSAKVELTTETQRRREFDGKHILGTAVVDRPFPKEGKDRAPKFNSVLDPPEIPEQKGPLCCGEEYPLPPWVDLLESVSYGF